MFFSFVFFILLSRKKSSPLSDQSSKLAGAAPLSYSKLLLHTLGSQSATSTSRLVLFSFEDMRAHAVHNFPLTNLAFLWG